VITAVKLLQQAVGLLIRSPLKTLTVVAPALVLMATVGAIAAAVAPGLLSGGPTAIDLSSTKAGAQTLGLLMAYVVSYALMAILWHRHTLADTLTPKPMTLPLLFGYLWRVIALSLIQLAVSLALVVPLVLLSHSGNGSDAAPALISMYLSTFITQLVLLWLSLRLSLILPAAALGKPMRMALSWRYTQPIAAALWGVAAALALANTFFASLIAVLDLASPGHRLAIELPIFIVEGLLIFSVLTTLYSLQVQKQL